MGFESLNHAPDTTESHGETEKKQVQPSASPKESEHQRVRRASSESLDQLRTSQAEARLDTASRTMESRFDAVITTVEKQSKKLQPIIEKIFEFQQRMTDSLRSLIAPYIPHLQKMGMTVPEWLMAGVPGLAMLNAVLQKTQRILVPDAKNDAAGMRMLMKEHKKLERQMKAKGKTYTFEEYLEEVVSDMPGNGEQVRIQEIGNHSTTFAKTKEVEIAKLADADSGKKKEEKKKEDESKKEDSPSA